MYRSTSNIIYQTFGPNVSPSATVFLTAVYRLSAVSKTVTLPHHCGIVAFGKVMAKKIIIVERTNPESRAAAVM